MAYDPGADAGLQRFIDATTISLTKQIGAAVVASGATESQVLDFLGKTLGGEKLVQSFGSEFTQAHRDVGKAAIRSIAQAYTHRRFKRPSDSYRVGDQRYAGRALYRALAGHDDAHVSAHARGFFFLDTGILDQEAKQWRRINFGAGGGSQGGIQAPQRFEVEWAGLVVGALGLAPDPRPAFKIPRGFWFAASGERVGADSAARTGRFFYVGSPEMPTGRHGRPSPARRTAGIASSNFLDAGMRRIANDLPRAYETLYGDLYDQQFSKLTEVGQTVGVRVPAVPAPQVIKRFHRGTRYG